MMGWFIGSGRTTVLLRLARQLQGAAKRFGIIANEQAVGLAFIPACAEHQS
jgi:G3E family GTPase